MGPVKSLQLRKKLAKPRELLRHPCIELCLWFPIIPSTKLCYKSELCGYNNVQRRGPGKIDEDKGELRRKRG